MSIYLQNLIIIRYKFAVIRQVIKEVSRKMFTTFILTNILQTFFYQFDLIYRIGKKGVEIAYSQSKSYTVLQFKVILCKFRDFGKMRPQILHNLLTVLN